MRNFFRSNFILLILLNLASVFTYLFQLLVGRALTPEDFGVFNSINSIGFILTTPAMVLSLVYSKNAVILSLKGLEHVKGLLISGLRNTIFMAIVFLLFGILSISWIKSFLHLNTIYPILIMLFGLALSIIIPVVFGVLQGLNRYWSFGIGSVSIPLGRFLFGIPLLFLFSLGVDGAMLAGVLASLVTLTIGLWSVRDIMYLKTQELVKGTKLDMLRYSLPVFLTTAMGCLLYNLDLILVRHYCSPEEAGFYSIAAIIGRVALYLPGTLTNVLFPEAVKGKEIGRKDSNILMWSNLTATIFLGGGIAFFCWFWPKEIVSLLFGEKYIYAAPLLPFLSLGMAFLAVANSIFTYNLARSNYLHLWPMFFGVVVELVLITLIHDSALVIAKTVLFSIVLVNILILVRAFLAKKNSTKPLPI